MNCTQIQFDPTTSLDDILQYLHFYPHTSIINVTKNQNITDFFIDEILQSSNVMKVHGLVIADCFRLTHRSLLSLCQNPRHSQRFLNKKEERREGGGGREGGLPGGGMILGQHTTTTLSAGAAPAAVAALALEVLDMSGCSAIVTDQILSELGQNISFRLTTFSVKNCFRLTDVGFQSLAGPACQHITTLDLSGCGQITDTALTSLALYMPNLQHLNLQGCMKLTSESLIILAENCRHLLTLNLRGCLRICDAGVSHLSYHSHSLETLNIQGCVRVTDVALYAVIRSCPNLSCLDIRRCSGISHESIANALTLSYRFQSMYDDGNNNFLGAPAAGSAANN
jgi:hypothetical protein